MGSTFSDYQVYARDMTKSLQREATKTSVASQAKYYEANIGKVKTVDAFLKNYRLYSYALKAYGLDDMTNAKAFIRKVLESDVNDTNSFANKLTDKRFIQFAKAFNFITQGVVINNGDIQTDTQEEETLGLYTQVIGSSTAMIETEQEYYKKMIGSVESVDELLADETLYKIALKAFGLDPATESKATIRKVLESDVADRNSFAVKSKKSGYEALAAAYNFAGDGSVAAPRVAQNARDSQTVSQAYMLLAAKGKAAQTAAKAEAKYYEETISTITSVDELLSDKRLVAFIVKANSLPANTTTETLRKVLTSDLSSKSSFANKQSDLRYRDLAASFHFNADGLIKRTAAQEIQSEGASLSTKSNYLRQSMENGAGEKNQGIKLALYFQRKASSIHSAYDILGDRALLKVVQVGLGLSATSAKASIDIQARNIEKGLKLADLQDPAKVAKFVARFAALYDMTGEAEKSSEAPSLMTLYK